MKIKIKMVTNRSEGQAYGSAWQVTIPASVSGKRVRKQFATKADAETFAREQHNGSKELGKAFFCLSAPDQIDAINALALVRPLNLTLTAAISAYLAGNGQTATPGKPLAELVNDTLRAWLAPLAKTTGLIFPARSLQHSRKQLRAKGHELPDNALRHSSISYAVVSSANIGQVAADHGTSPEKIHSNYRALVTPANASAYFALRPALA